MTDQRLTPLERAILEAAKAYGRTEGRSEGVAHRKKVARLGLLLSRRGPDADPKEAEYVKVVA